MYFPKDMNFQYFFFDTYIGYFLQALPIALIPNVATMKMMYNKDRRLAVVYLIAVAILCLCCFAMCGWNIKSFLV